MATKPVNNLAEWADSSNGGNYTGGPYAGQPRKVSIPAGVAAEGFRPGALDPSAAEHINDWLNQVSLFIRWVYAGSSAGAADAHLVETDSNGRSRLERLAVISANNAPNALLAQGPPIAGNAIFASSDNPFGDATVYALSDGPGAAVQATSTDTGHAIEATSTGVTCVDIQTSGNSAHGIDITTSGSSSDGIVVNTSGTGADGGRFIATGTAAYGVYAQVNSTTSIAVQGLCVDNGVAGGRFFGGQVSGRGVYAEAFADAAIYATGGVFGAAAVMALGKGAAVGVRGGGGPDGASGVEGIGTGTSAGVVGLGPNVGVQGIATSPAGVQAYGVHGLSPVGSGPNDAGVRGDGLDEAMGGFFTSDLHHALYLSPSGYPDWAPHMRMSGRQTPPTLETHGGTLFAQQYGGGLGESYVKTFVKDIARFMFHTAGGAAVAWDYSISGVVDDSGDAVCTCTLTGADSPIVTGTVMLIAVAEVGRNSGTPNVIATLFDNTQPVAVVGPSTVLLYHGAGADVYERSIVYVYPRVLPAAGDRTFSLELKSDTVGANINYRNAGIFALGVF